MQSRRLSTPLSRGSGRGAGRGVGGEGPRPPSPVLFLIYIGLLFLSPPIRAHELGTIQVAATFRQGGSWRVDVAIDEEHIPRLPLDTVRPAGETRYGPIAGLTPELRARLGVFLSQLADRSALSFDGRLAAPERLSVDRPPPPADDPFAPPPKITLHLEGAIPPGARAATFSTTVPVGRYPLAFLNEGDLAPSRRWQQGGPGKPQTSAGEPFPLSPRVVPPALGRVALQYLGLGFRHILPQGAEPILFVLGIFLLGRRLPPLLAQGAVFAVASLLASAAAVYGWASLSPRIVEPALALSLLYVAVENLLTREGKAARLALVAVGGLLYGLSFGFALRPLGPPRAVLPVAVLGFGLGAVGGLLAVLAAAFLLVGLPFRHQPWYRHRVVIPASCALLTLGLYWSIERIFHP